MSEGVQRPQRREIDPETGLAKLHHPHGAGQIGQPVAAQIGQPCPIRQAVRDMVARCTRQQRLSAMSQFQQRGSARSDIQVAVPIPRPRLPGVQAYPQLEWGKWRALQVQGTCDGVRGPGEGDHEAVIVAAPVPPRTPVACDGLARNRLEPGHSLRPELRRLGQPFDVDEQQRHGSGR